MREPRGRSGLEPAAVRYQRQRGEAADEMPVEALAQFVFLRPRSSKGTPESLLGLPYYSQILPWRAEDLPTKSAASVAN